MRRTTYSGREVEKRDDEGEQDEGDREPEKYERSKVRRDLSTRGSSDSSSYKCRKSCIATTKLSLLFLLLQHLTLDRILPLLFGLAGKSTQDNTILEDLAFVLGLCLTEDFITVMFFSLARLDIVDRVLTPDDLLALDFVPVCRRARARESMGEKLLRRVNRGAAGLRGVLEVEEEFGRGRSW